MPAKEFIDQIVEENRQRFIIYVVGTAETIRENFEVDANSAEEAKEWAIASFYAKHPKGRVLQATPQLRTAESEGGLPHQA